ncbi:helix-turn-helix domain-containing protein [Halobacterium wangiae]|uniref:helix-turn-helix domain-containing protein n=1 Tax=Halobacterium wangiae TaxID=2902623 RepID=UPI001E47FA63|nr:helix-turn-helix domain-containing protein [Halobacterium wangiae]
MSKLEGVSATDLRDALADADDAKAAKRLLVALAYQDGVPVATLSDRYGVPESTIYYWLDRFDTNSLEDAARDDPRPGRPPRLSDSQRDSVAKWLEDPPTAYGLETDEWTPELLRNRISDAFGVDYSLGHVRRLCRTLGPSE